MGGVQGLEALDQPTHGRQRRLGTVLCGAGQRGLQLVAQVRECRQIPRMGKRGAQPGFIVPPLAPGDYTLKLKIVDTVAKQSYTLEQKFKITG